MKKWFDILIYLYIYITEWWYLQQDNPDYPKYIKIQYFGEQHIGYKIKQLKKTGTFVILNNISDYVTLVKLMDSLGNVNHAVSVVMIQIMEKPWRWLLIHWI